MHVPTHQNTFTHAFPAEDYHGINGNVSLDRRSEIVQSPNRYDLVPGGGGSASDRSNNNSLSRTSEAGTYDLSSAEARARNIFNNNSNGNGNGNGLHTVDENVINNNNNNVHHYQNQPTAPTHAAMIGNNGVNGGSGTLRSIDEEIKKKKWPTDRAYFLAKELLMTERTYKKDLDVLNTVRICVFRQEKWCGNKVGFRFSGSARN